VLERTSELATAHSQLVAQVRRSDQADLRLRELQVELSHAGRLSTAGQMAAALAHELQQPLTAATGAANAARRLLTQSTSENSVAVRTILDEIAGHSMRAGQILRRLRDFMSRGKIEKRVESVPSLVEDAVSFAMAGSGALGIAVHVSLDPAAATVCANRIQVQQVVVNLMRNAFEAMATSPRRELYLTSARLDPQTIEIAVADTGSGLTAEVANRLFEPFLSTKSDGMGLGLSLCRSLVEAHGGQLRYEANPAGGAIFRFTLSSGEDHVG
jgi:C4-dicarboxylate-specific signal transduction histidine kinase